jgi:basic membrane lipoprotein Med (substrate-binding protein (PBP1-ABC) superfamily)
MNPKVVWVNKWFDPPKETEAAQALLDQGADVLMQNTDSSAVLKTAEKAGKYAFGWDSDMSTRCPRNQRAILRSLSLIGKSLMLAKRRCIRPSSRNSHCSLP